MCVCVCIWPRVNPQKDVYIYIHTHTHTYTSIHYLSSGGQNLLPERALAQIKRGRLCRARGGRRQEEKWLQNYARGAEVSRAPFGEPKRFGGGAGIVVVCEEEGAPFRILGLGVGIVEHGHLRGRVSLCVHVYICVYMCIYVYICICIYVYIYMYICVYMCVYISTCIYTYICVYVCVVYVSG